MKTIVVLSGAGMSAESGLRTFRDNGGLKEDHRLEDVAAPAQSQKFLIDPNPPSSGGFHVIRHFLG